MDKHSSYTPEYKLEAVRLARTEGISDTARNPGINPNMPGRWKKEHETRAAQTRPVFTGRGVSALTEQEREFQQLRRDLEIARQERDILKKPLPFSPRKPAEIQVHPRSQKRVQSRDQVSDA